MAAVLPCPGTPIGYSCVQQISGAEDGEESQADLGSALSWARQPKGIHSSSETIAVLERARAQDRLQRGKGVWA